MAMIRINLNPSKGQLRLFGATWLVFFGALGALLLSKGHQTPAVAVWAAAGVVPLVGWFVPAVLRTVYLGMTFAAYPIGLVVSHVILATVYYLVLTPIGLLRRCFAGDPMTRRFEPDRESYWVERPARHDVERYFRQS